MKTTKTDEGWMPEDCPAKFEGPCIKDHLRCIYCDGSQKRDVTTTQDKNGETNLVAGPVHTHCLYGETTPALASNLAQALRWGKHTGVPSDEGPENVKGYLAIMSDFGGEIAKAYAPSAELAEQNVRAKSPVFRPVEVLVYKRVK